MAIDVRRIDAGEIDGWVRSVRVPFLQEPRGERADAAVEAWSALVDPASTWAAVDGGHFVGNCNTLRLDLALPGTTGGPCPSVALAGVTAVGVHPTHRRRGVLSRMMASMLADAVDRGEAVAGLFASEAAIYGRFGFGPATQLVRSSLTGRESAFAVPATASGIRLVEPDEAATLLPDLHERARLRQPGQVSRIPGAWDFMFADPPTLRDGSSGLFYAVTDGGYVAYRAARTDGGYRRLVVDDLAATDPAVEAALWRFLLDVDLVREVESWTRVDDPLRHRLVDPRALRTAKVEDALWLRVLDVAAAFAARRYPTEGRLVVDVAPAASGTGDSGRPDPAAGRWTLDAGPDGASCRPAAAGESTDLCLGAAELGTLLLGGHRASVLAGAGKVGEERPGALALADRLFASSPAPYCTTGF